MLNEQEKQFLRIIADNENVFAVLKKVFHIDPNAQHDLNKNNEELGATVRARIEANTHIENCLKIISDCQTPAPKKARQNPPR